MIRKLISIGHPFLKKTGSDMPTILIYLLFVRPHVVVRYRLQHDCAENIDIYRENAA